jgi:hypothetical protein
LLLLFSQLRHITGLRILQFVLTSRQSGNSDACLRSKVGISERRGGDLVAIGNDGMPLDDARQLAVAQDTPLIHDGHPLVEDQGRGETWSIVCIRENKRKSKEQYQEYSVPFPTSQISAGFLDVVKPPQLGNHISFHYSKRKVWNGKWRLLLVALFPMATFGKYSVVAFSG